ncbi:MAG: lipopolysaccharide heptosyltransferase II [Candidatus Omnitrophota bacterium]
MDRKISRILFITLSNIGDCIMTLPTLDMLISRYPQAQITVMSGPRTKEIFENNPNIHKFILYDKHSTLKENIKQLNELKKENFDLVVDLRNTFFGVFLPTHIKTSPFLFIPKEIRHMRDRHLYQLGARAAELKAKTEAKSLYISRKDQEYVENLFKENGILPESRIAAVAPGTRSHIKRWQKEKFAELISSLGKEFGLKIILIGDKEDSEVARFIKDNTGAGIIDFTSRTTITQLACLLKKAELLITGDSGVMHLASYLNVPVAAVFGPTDEEKYGPWSKVASVIKKDIFCRPCSKAQCKFGTLDCMRVIKTTDVFLAVKDILNPRTYGPTDPRINVFKRILIVRTDRMGDVLLSTPVIRVLRRNFPNSYLAMMVSASTKDIVEGNPYLDEVIIYDKDGRHKGWQQTFRFARNLKKKRFDLAIILHPTNRVHLVTYLAAIPRRIGYDRKLSFLLTDRIPHTKQSGLKHELEYNLDLLKYLGIEAEDKELFMPVKNESEKTVEKIFASSGIRKTDKILAIHPSASCPSKVWPADRFAQVADILAQEHGFKIVAVSGPKDIARTEDVINRMHCAVIDLAGKVSVSQLASVFKRCALFISNDSGPVHMAAALGIPVISIFGRAQAGLSPKRWAPMGKAARVLHKQVGCIECLAHNCQKGFACLKAITVEEVVSAAESLLS